MRQVLRWVTVVVLCCAASATAGEPPRDARLEEAQTAYTQAVTLSRAARYAEAVAQGERALVLVEAVLGSTHPGVADCLSLLGDVRQRQGDLDRAEPLHQRALAIHEAALGKHHPNVATSLNNLASLYQARGLYGRAEPLYQRALAIREAALGKHHPDVAGSLNNLAVLYRSQGHYSRAEPLYQRALAIREAALGKHHPDVAGSLNNLAVLYQTQGHYSRAEPLYQRALAIREAALGKHHPDVAQSLNNLALLSQARGQYSRAEPLYQRALAICEAALGKHHPDVAQSLNNLAVLYQARGLYGRAEPLYQRALALREAALGKHHPDVAQSLNNLAILYLDQGLYSRAEPLYVRAHIIQEAALGKHHPDVATSLNNLASLYQAQGLYGRAAPLHQRALAIREAALGKHHPDVATSLNTLALLYQAQRHYSRAEPLYARALAICEAALGKHHPDVATSLNNLAVLYHLQGLYERAEPLYERALDIRSTVLGKNHPSLAKPLLGLALLKLGQQRLDAAVALFSRVLALSEQRLRHEALDFSEARLTSLLQLLRSTEESLYALLRAHPDDAGVRRLALGAALLFKGRSVEETAGISRAVYRSLGAEERDTLEQLRGLRTRLASLSLQGPGPLPLPVYQQRLKELTAQADALEASLATRSAPLRTLAALPAPDDIVDRVAQALPKDGALVEFIAYQDSPLVPEKAPSAPHLRYLAMVLLPDASIRVLDLGPAAPIDSAASRLRDAMANREAAFQAHAQALYQLAFQPLLPLLGTTRRLFVSPDGQLSLVPFAALHDGHQFLVDTFNVTYVTSGKELLPRPQQPAPVSSIVVLADPDFSAPPQLPASSKAAAPAERSIFLESFFSTRSEGVVKRGWNLVPLPGTRQEALAIQRLLPQAQLFLGPEATKERLLEVSTPSILHVATHGFFLEDAPAPAQSRAVFSIDALADEGQAPRPQDPLLRSGLLFAGANATSASAARPPSDTALATALELAGLDLWGTQLVVLSACDTGRGDVKRGQGVHGLRRALVVAGAETLVTSLWKVNDDTTRQLMEAYYQKLLEGQGRATSLREAMLELRKTQPHPHHWAPFIALGQDTPLRGLGPGPRGK